VLPGSGPRESGVDRTRQSLAALAQHAVLQVAWCGALRLGRTVRRRVDTRARRTQSIQERVRWTPDAAIRLPRGVQRTRPPAARHSSTGRRLAPDRYACSDAARAAPTLRAGHTRDEVRGGLGRRHGTTV